MTMTLQKDFFICFASSRWLGILLFMESKKIYALFSSLRHDCEIQEISFFTADTNFFSPEDSRPLKSRTDWGRKARVTKSEFNIGY